MQNGKKMINKKNWKLIKAYLNDRLHVDQITMGSWKIEESCIRYLLEWADDVSFVKASSISPTFPEYMRSARLDGKSEPVSPAHTKKVLATARRFFLWLIDYDREYRTIKLAWINKIKAKRLNDIPQTKEYVTLEEIIRIANAPVETVVERRIRASAVFWYLSGIRIGAFVTLPIKAVDIENRFVFQYTSMGVHTKNSKSAKTILFPIPELLKVCLDWDQELKKVISGEGFWFAPLYPETGEINPNCTEPNDTRVMLARKNLKEWLIKVGLPYHSPHKFRHGHVHYGQAHSKTQEDYKAISQNVMHSTTGVTDQFYSNMDDDMKKKRIDSMFGGGQLPENSDQDFEEFRQFLAWKKLKIK
jgi:integrase